MSNKHDTSTILQWGSDFAESYQHLEGQWYLNATGTQEQVSHAAKIIMTEIDSWGVFCPDSEDIMTACYELSKAGIPTLMSDPVLDKNEQYTGGPVTPASLAGALKIWLGTTQAERVTAVVLITTTGMVRVFAESEFNTDDVIAKKAHLLAGILNAFGGEIVSNHCGSIGDVVRLGDGGFTIGKKNRYVYMMFPLWGNPDYPKGIWIGGRGDNKNENDFLDLSYLSK